MSWSVCMHAVGFVIFINRSFNLRLGLVAIWFFNCFWKMGAYNVLFVCNTSSVCLSKSIISGNLRLRITASISRLNLQRRLFWNRFQHQFGQNLYFVFRLGRNTEYITPFLRGKDMFWPRKQKNTFEIFRKYYLRQRMIPSTLVRTIKILI